MKKTLGQGKFLKLVMDGKWEFVERVNATGVVGVTALTADRRIILTEQFRPAVGRFVIDLPAGLAGDIKGQEQEGLEVSALRELLEETGYHATRLTSVADCPSSPGLTSEVVSMFVAQNVRKTSDGGGIDGEAIIVHSPFLRGIDRWLKKQVNLGKLIDGKVFAGLYFARNSRQRAAASGQKSEDRKRS